MWPYVFMLLPITLFCIVVMLLPFGGKMFKPKFKMNFDEATQLFDLVSAERTKLWEDFPKKCGEEAVKMDKKIVMLTSLLTRLSDYRQEVRL